jgi:prepilin-type N-terminal cleavage/methylation domain-containing protein
MNNKGFTMAEVVVTIAILGIMATIAIPSFISWLPRHKLQTSVRQIYDDLNLAKMEAVRRNTDVFIKFYPDTETYSVILDSDNSGTLTGGDVPLKNNIALENGVNINNTTFGASNAVGFNNRGMAVGNPGTINVSNPTGNGSIQVNIAGNISAS